MTSVKSSSYSGRISATGHMDDRAAIDRVIYDQAIPRWLRLPETAAQKNYPTGIPETQTHSKPSTAIHSTATHRIYALFDGSLLKTDSTHFTLSLKTGEQISRSVHAENRATEYIIAMTQS